MYRYFISQHERKLKYPKKTFTEIVYTYQSTNLVLNKEIWINDYKDIYAPSIKSDEYWNWDKILNLDVSSQLKNRELLYKNDTFLSLDPLVIDLLIAFQQQGGVILPVQNRTILNPFRIKEEEFGVIFCQIYVESKQQNMILNILNYITYNSASKYPGEQISYWDIKKNPKKAHNFFLLTFQTNIQFLRDIITLGFSRNPKNFPIPNIYITDRILLLWSLFSFSSNPEWHLILRLVGFHKDTHEKLALFLQENNISHDFVSESNIGYYCLEQPFVHNILGKQNQLEIIYNNNNVINNSIVSTNSLINKK